MFNGQGNFSDIFKVKLSFSRPVAFLYDDDGLFYFLARISKLLWKGTLCNCTFPARTCSKFLMSKFPKANAQCFHKIAKILKHSECRTTEWINFIETKLASWRIQPNRFMLIIPRAKKFAWEKIKSHFSNVTRRTFGQVSLFKTFNWVCLFQVSPSMKRLNR